MPNLIVQRAGILGGKPYVSGTRLTVDFIREQLALGVTGEELRRAYPQLTAEGLEAARRYVVQVVKKGVLRPRRGRHRPATGARQPLPLSTDVFVRED